MCRRKSSTFNVNSILSALVLVVVPPSAQRDSFFNVHEKALKNGNVHYELMQLDNEKESDGKQHSLLRQLSTAVERTCA